MNIQVGIIFKDTCTASAWKTKVSAERVPRYEILVTSKMKAVKNC